MFSKTTVFFIITLTFFKSTKSADLTRKKISVTNVIADAALFKVRVHREISGFEPIDVSKFNVIAFIWDHDVFGYNFTMHEGKLTSVKTLKRYADVNVTEMRDGYNNVDIPLTFDPLKYEANYTVVDLKGRRVTGRATATVSNVKAIFITKYRLLFQLNLQDVSVTYLGDIDLDFKPSGQLVESARPEVKKRLREVIAQRVEKSITDYFRGNKNSDQLGLINPNT